MASGKKLIYFSVIFLLLILLSTGIIYYWVILPSRVIFNAGEKIVNGISDAFDFSPRITTENTVIFEEQAAIFEVAVYSQRLVYDYEYSNTWMGSTKELHLRGIYLAKYGFNLKEQKFTVDISKQVSDSGSGYDLTFQIPEPVLLSFETDNYRVILDKDGWWNRFDKNDREQAVNTMREAARIKAVSLDYRNKVKESIESQIKIMIAGLPLEIPLGKVSFQWQNQPSVKELDNLHGK